MIRTCNGCNGEYDDILADGTSYFHVCPEGVAPASRRDENPVSTDEADQGRIRAKGAGFKTTTATERQARIDRERAEFEAHAKK